MNYFLCILIIIFITLSNTNINFYGEYSVLEIFQLMTLMFCIFFHLKSRKFFKKLSNLLTYNLRLFFLIFLFYEEASFFSKNLKTQLSLFNLQSELNFHNSKLFNKVIFEFNSDLLNQNFSLTTRTLFYTCFIFCIGCGLFFPFLRRFRYLLLEKKFAPYSFIFFSNLIFSSFLRRFIDPSMILIIHHEFIELFFYIIFLLDIFIKKTTIRKITDY